MLPDRRDGVPAGEGRQAPKRPPSFGFLKGAGLGIVVVIPTVALAAWCLTRLGFGDPTVTMADQLRMTALFAGAAAVLTAGGIGRLAADAAVAAGGRVAAVVRAARAQAVASAGLTIIALIPGGGLPEQPARWAWIAVGGALAGAVAGAIVGLVCGAPRAPRVPTLPDLLRRTPMVAELKKAAEQARRAGTDPRKVGRRALITETARQATPPARPGQPTRAHRIDATASTAASTATDTAATTDVATDARTHSDPGHTPLPIPIPLGEESTTGVEAPPQEVAPAPAERRD